MQFACGQNLQNACIQNLQKCLVQNCKQCFQQTCKNVCALAASKTCKTTQGKTCKNALAFWVRLSFGPWQAHWQAQGQSVQPCQCAWPCACACILIYIGQNVERPSFGPCVLCYCCLLLFCCCLFWQSPLIVLQLGNAVCGKLQCKHKQTALTFPAVLGA